MARVRPFKAWRYASDRIDITPLTAPPYDVISDEKREQYAALDINNVVDLELPKGSLDPDVSPNRYSTGRATWEHWKSEGVVVQDPHPALYVLEQRFVSPSGTEVSRRAFIAEVGLEPFDAGIVLPHERTLPKALGDRFELIKATAANFSQVFGLFEDASCETDPLFETVMSSEPIATATADDGVTSTLWLATDETVTDRLTSFMADRRIFIADGHHRYTTALAYRDLRRSEGGDAMDDPASDWVMMALVNMDDPDLEVLAYHRIADAEGDFDADAFKRDLSRHFELTELPAGGGHRVFEEVDRPRFLIRARGDEHPFVATLRADVDPALAIPGEHSAAWKSLDVAVVQELVLWPLLGVHPDHPETLERLSFTKDAHLAFHAVEDHDVAIVLRPTGLDQLRQVSMAGETMPQKSTYFYPKLLSGLLFRSA